MTKGLNLTARGSNEYEDLTLQDDFMFCKVMQDPKLCKKLIEIILSDTIGKIAYVSVQHSINTYEQAKSVRFDVLVQAESGKFYDVEMQVSNERNIPKRIRFYQAAIDISFLDKGNSYNALNGCFIIFICTFDAIGNQNLFIPLKISVLKIKTYLYNTAQKKL